MNLACSTISAWAQPMRPRSAQAPRRLVCSCAITNMATATSSWRSAAPGHLAFMTPGQFSSFHGTHMMLPSIYVSRAKMATGARMRMPPQMSFLGVGAPEALLVGVVALVVFGPKGLADAAKSIGNTLRAFQPTIKEVVSVSQDIKGTLERELGLDELRDAARVAPRSRLSDNTPSMDDLMRTNSAAGFAAADEDPEIEAKRRASAAAAWGNQTPASTADGSQASASGQQGAQPAAANIPETLTQPATAKSAAAPAPAQAPASAPAPAPAAAPGALGTLSVEQLEAELARRRAGQQSQV